MTDYRQKILVVDDEPSERRIIREIFSPDDYLIFEAADASDAVEQVFRDFFDLVLMDDRMSLMDDIEALKEIRLISPAIPVMIIADYPTTDNAIAAFRAGALDYLIKPLNADWEGTSEVLNQSDAIQILLSKW